MHLHSDVLSNALHWIKYTDTLIFLVCSNAGLENDKKHWMKECDRLKQDLCQANSEMEALQARLNAVENTDEKVNILNNSVTYYAVCHINFAYAHWRLLYSG